MRTITLELLRHGTPHNQLLSPLVPYLAVCDNHPATTIYLPVTHAEALHSIEDLRYIGGVSASEVEENKPLKQSLEQRRRHALTTLGKLLGEWLGGVPGLVSSLGKVGDEFVHLRIVLSANELALLPFELMVSPDGFPGAGQHTSLQARTPVCITRESRRAPRDFYTPPLRPRILFAFAEFAGMSVPYEAHLQAIVNALQPWCSDKAPFRLEDMITLLPNPSLAEIEAVCADADYSHIHVLGHGSRLDENRRDSFLTIMWPDGRGGVEHVTGRNLARALRPVSANGNCLAKPQFVCVAACDSSATVEYPLDPKGSSFTHALHEAGIPLVLGSQFPLTFAGSVVMADVCFSHLLAGRDPREMLVDLRRRLAVRTAYAHDWASMLCYASIAPESRQSDRRYRFKRLGLRFECLAARDWSADRDAEWRTLEAEFKTLIQSGKFSRIERGELNRMLAGVLRRIGAESDRPEICAEFAGKAQAAYMAAYALNPELDWVLTSVLRESLLAEPADQLPNGLTVQQLWRARIAGAEVAMRLAMGTARAWGLSELIELGVLSAVVEAKSEFSDGSRIRALIADLVKMDGEAPTVRSRLVGQLKRFLSPSHSRFAPCRPLVVIALTELGVRQGEPSTRESGEFDSGVTAKASTRKRGTTAPKKKGSS